MLATKVEIKLKKAEPGSWSKLDFPKTEPKKEATPPPQQAEIEDDCVDLSSVEPIQCNQVNISG